MIKIRDVACGLWYIVFFVLILGGCKKEEGNVLAKVGKTTFTDTEFYSLIPAQYVGVLTSAQKKELLKRWIDTELLYQEAIKEKLHKDSKIKASLHEIEREMLANGFLERHLSKLGSVEESEVMEYFNVHKEEYNTERQIAQIVVKDEAQTYEILGKLKEGRLFSALAKEHSLDPSSKHGGVMGYIRRGDMPQLPEFETALYSLKEIGDISEPVQTIYGYHIIKLLGIRKLSKEVKYEDVKEDIRNSLNLTRQKTALSTLLSGLREKKGVEENYELLR